MIAELLTRCRQGYRTVAFPPADPKLSDRFRGCPSVDASKCASDCRSCQAVCPVQALERDAAGLLRLDLGECLFCRNCENACPQKAIRFSQDYRLAARKREDLMLTPGGTLCLAQALDEKTRKLFGRSLKLRQVSAGGCNACEADTNVLNTLVFDLGRFGVQFVASPRHADGLLVTGPVTENMREALKQTYDALPSPRLVIAVGSCAISGGPYKGQAEAHDGAGRLLPVDLFVPGCPPHPFTILDGLLRLLGRLEKQS